MVFPPQLPNPEDFPQRTSRPDGPGGGDDFPGAAPVYRSRHGAASTQAPLLHGLLNWRHTSLDRTNDMGAFLMISLRCIPGYGWIATCALIAVLTSPLSSAATGETVCIQCHTAQTGKGHEPVKPWQGSIHAENGISCHNCHGGDSRDIVNAMNPERGFLGVPKERSIPDFCDHCHIGIKADYLRSAHGRALGKGGPVCITCHGSHDIKKASLDLINEKSCTRCHSYDRARLIRGAMEKTETSLAGLAQRIEAFKGKGVDTAA